MAETADILNFNRDLLGESDRFASDLTDAGVVVDGDTLAKLVKVHPRTVRDLAQRDIVAKVGTDRYDLVASLQAYATHLREMAAGRGDEHQQLQLTAERARLAKEQADAQALKNAALRRDLVPAAEVEREWSDTLRLVRSKILALPSRLRQTLAHLTAADVAAIDSELRRTLEELAHEDD